MRKISKISLLLACTALAGCGGMADRLASVGQAPAMSNIENPVTKTGYQPVSLPMPSPVPVETAQNSLWSSDRQTFFKDMRAARVGDIITVVIDIEDEAQLENESSRTRASNENAALPSLLGYEQSLAEVLPEGINPANLAEFGADSSHAGSGTVEREEEIDVRLAALITQILPNGNMVVSGRQEVLVNFEKRILEINGVIRPEDITTENTISYEKIAEARIVYGGEGQITDVQQPRYGQQIYDVVFPF